MEKPFEIKKLVFDTVIGDLKFLKNQQWKITNYVLLTYAAIYTISKLFYIESGIHLPTKIVSSILVILLSASGISLLYLNNKDILLARERIETCKKEFGPYYRSILKPQSVNYKNNISKFLLLLMYFIILLGGTLTILLIYYLKKSS